MKGHSTQPAYRRLLSMNREEIADRIRQRIQARVDVLRYNVGGKFVPRMELGATYDLPRFFFVPEAVPHLCARLREMFPADAKEIVDRAERICLHRFDLLGYEALDYGPKIDWHCDRVHGK